LRKHFIGLVTIGRSCVRVFRRGFRGQEVHF